MSGRGVWLLAAALATLPVERIPADVWAERHRVVPAESGSPFPGRWLNATAPHLSEPTNEMSLDRPARTVSVMKSAQTGFTEAALNATGHTIDQHPCPILWMYPTLEAMIRFDRLKLSLMLDSSPRLRELLKEPKSRDEKSPTIRYKPFTDGFLQLVAASSSSDLQTFTARVRYFDEVTEYPEDTAGRGDPIAQAAARSIAWLDQGTKAVFISTPGIEGSCRITARFQAGDQRRWFTPCPECNGSQALSWDDVRWRQDKRPYGAYVVCRGCGAVIEGQKHKASIKNGRWIPTYDDPADPGPPPVIPAGLLDRWAARASSQRDPSYHFWQGQSPFVPLDEVVAAWLEAQGKPDQLKAFWQQWLGLPWAAEGEAPETQRLLERRQNWPPGRLPAGVLFQTGSVDVQGDRLEWAVYGWGRDFAQYIIATGVIPGDPAGDEPWFALDEMRRAGAGPTPGARCGRSTPGASTPAI
jgi:phage terminase large subunit GpA-like protein